MECSEVDHDSDADLDVVRLGSGAGCHSAHTEV